MALLSIPPADTVLKSASKEIGPVYPRLRRANNHRL